MKTTLIRKNGRLKIKQGCKSIEPFIVRLNSSEFDCEHANLLLYPLVDAWVGNGKFDLSALDNLNKNKKYILVLNLAAPNWWKNEYGYSDLTNSLACEKWTHDATDFLQAVCEKTKNTNNILGYQLTCGEVGWNWGFLEDNLTDEKIALVKKFCGDISLNAQMLSPDKNDAFIAPEYLEDVCAYRKFIALLAFDTVAHFAFCAKEFTPNKLLGIEFACPFTATQTALWDQGQLCFDKVFSCSDIDFIASSEYTFEGTFATVFDSVDLHQKLYFHKANEKDFGAFSCDALNCLTKGAATSVSKQFFEENFDNISSFNSAKGAVCRCKKQQSSQTCVLVSSEGMFCVNKQSGLNNYLFADVIKSLSKLCAPVDVFSFADKDKINFDAYKLIVFVDLFKLSAKEREQVELLKSNGRTLLWLYAPDYYGENLAKLQTLTDMSIIRLIGEENSVSTHLGDIRFAELPEPRFFVEDGDVMPLGVYPNTEKTAIGLKKFSSYASCYSATGSINGAVLNDIARIASVKLYSIGKVAVFTDGAFLGAYSYEDTFILLEDNTYVDLISGNKLIAKDGKLELKKGQLVFIKR